MCGIAGIISYKSTPDNCAVEKMCSSISHRGPDSQAVENFSNASLGACRLSVIDISDNGTMPLTNEDDSLVIVYNGEVYNFQELQKELTALGHKFKSNTDTEVILHSYEEWGEKCLDRFNGMFSFVIWDKKKNEAFAARDRLGVKPFFYLQTEDQFIFCSELHPLFEFEAPDTHNIRKTALDYYLSFAYVPSDRTFTGSIQKLPPASKLKISDNSFNIERYWDINFLPKHNISEDEAYEEVDRLLNEAVKKRLVSDVPLGCFLSGGIDSSLVTAIAAINSSKKIKTFSVGFPGGKASDDERPLARLVAEKYGTEHTDLEVGMEGKGILSKILWHYGEPFGDLSCLAVYQISKAAREHITVALSGDGGDESFCGYVNIQAAYLADRFKAIIPGPIKNLVQSLSGSQLINSIIPKSVKVNNWLRQYVDKDVLAQYDLQNHWHQQVRKDLYNNSMHEYFNTAEKTIENILNKAKDLDDAEKHLFTDLHYRLPGDYLTKVDIASNIVSLEVRSPFMDYELIEFMARLPLSIKMKFGRQKYMLRRLAKKYLPEELIHQPKRGFGPSLSDWLRGDWSSLMEKYVADRLAQRHDLFNEKIIKDTVKQHISGQADHKTRLWSLFCLEIWFELFVDKTLNPGDEL
ncbi:MAG: asparagine synthase (glutamine-hydrolyzing) [Planctomycetota bacterium]|jgi:asparagine synthase (glutamine-hydrolysing)